MDKEKKEKNKKEPAKVETSKAENNKDNRSSLLIIFGVLIITLSVVAGLLFYQNQKVKEELAKYIQPTPAPTSEPTPTPESTRPNGFVGYNSDGKKFMLDFPAGCDEAYKDRVTTTTCTTDSFSVTINPQAGGYGIEGYEPAGMETGEIAVDGYVWNYKIWIDEDGTAFAAYDFTDPETEDYYLIHVEYDPYSIEAKEYFEDVLSTFRFLSTYETYCLEKNGTWINQYSECEYIDESICTEAGGVYNECESACRHEPEETICTKQCVTVCEF